MTPTKTGLYSTNVGDRFILLYWDGEDWVDQDGIRPCYKKVQWTGKPLFVPALRTWQGLDWIKSTERLPEVNQRCIVVWDGAIVPHTATLLRDEFHGDGFKWLASNGHASRDNPLYWMPCPAMPKKEKST